jgi:ubiquinone/menaquinone biosynthesis C-methylase UbiE
MIDDEYVLRSFDRQELDRLELQHEVWKSVTNTVIQHAGFKKADRLLDLGSGPGFLAFDLAHLVGGPDSGNR